jgi:hypothetical protein
MHPVPSFPMPNSKKVSAACSIAHLFGCVCSDNIDKASSAFGLPPGYQDACLPTSSNHKHTLKWILTEGLSTRPTAPPEHIYPSL